MSQNKERPEGQLNAVPYFMSSGYNVKSHKYPREYLRASRHIAKHNEDSKDGVEFFIAFIGLTARKQNESIQSLKQATKNPQSEQKYWINTQSDAFSRSANP